MRHLRHGTPVRASKHQTFAPHVATKYIYIPSHLAPSYVTLCVSALPLEHEWVFTSGGFCGLGRGDFVARKLVR